MRVVMNYCYKSKGKMATLRYQLLLNAGGDQFVNPSYTSISTACHPHIINPWKK